MASDTKVAHVDRDALDAVKVIARSNGMMIGPYISKVLRDHVERYNKKHSTGKLPL